MIITVFKNNTLELLINKEINRKSSDSNKTQQQNEEMKKQTRLKKKKPFV